MPSSLPTPTASSLIGQSLLDESTEWLYLAGEDPSPGDLSWTLAGYDDSNWSKGQGSFGAKDEAVAPLGNFTPKNLLPMKDSESAYIPTYFFRTAITLQDPAAVPALYGILAYDDAVIVYLNGVKLFEENLPPDGYSDRLSFGADSAQDEPRLKEFRVSASMLQSGDNILAVELHQSSAGSSDIYFALQSLEVIENENTLQVDGLCLFTGGDAQVTARWLGDGEDMFLNYAPMGEEQSDRVKSVPAVRNKIEAESKYRYSAPMQGLQAETTYTYWLESALGRTTFKQFTTPGQAFSFLLLGDPQLIDEASAGALEQALSWFPEASFALGAGDLTDSSEKTEQYRLFLNTPSFRSLPVAAVKGNHEGDTLYDFYFMPENLPSSGRDFCFSYANTLFVCLDSNNTDIAAHQMFLQQSIDAGQWDWVIVCMHHSMFSVGAHADEENIQNLQKEYAALFTAFDVDLVLSGHDHFYARTQLLENRSPAGEDLVKVKGQTLYISAGSSTGSKYYEQTNVDLAQFAALGKAERPVITQINVSSEQLSITTLYADDGTLADEAVLTRAQPNPPQPAIHQDVAEKETEWLLSTQLSNGAFAMYPTQEGEAIINPYFADYTALALLKAGEIQAVKAYLDWHFSHLNISETDVNGLTHTIYDYVAEVSGGIVVKETASMTYDSVDSYAATFLLLLSEYFDATGDIEYMKSNYPGITGVAQMLLSTVKDGLTLARPDYPVQYLMDNSEVWCALQAADTLWDHALYEGLPTSEKENCLRLQSELRVLRNSIAVSLETLLWNHDESRYEYARQSNDAIPFFDESRFYPEAISQLSPMIFGILPPESARATTLYRRFCETWDWTSLALTTTGRTNQYWGMAAYCAAVMRDEERLNAYLDAYQTQVMNEHAYPLFNADAAWVVLACLYSG